MCLPSTATPCRPHGQTSCGCRRLSASWGLVKPDPQMFLPKAQQYEQHIGQNKQIQKQQGKPWRPFQQSQWLVVAEKEETPPSRKGFREAPEISEISPKAVIGQAGEETQTLPQRQYPTRSPLSYQTQWISRAAAGQLPWWRHKRTWSMYSQVVSRRYIEI